MLDEEKIKQALDKHIPKVEFDDELRQRILESAKINTASGVGYSIKHKKCKILMLKRKVVYLTVAIVMVVSTVGCSFVIYNRSYVNHTVLPKLEQMNKFRIPKIRGDKDELGQVNKKYDSYEAVSKEIGIRLLNTPLAERSKYTQVKVITDNETQLHIEVNNYIIGDTIYLEYIEENDWYNFNPGENYTSPIKLEVDVLLEDGQHYDCSEDEITHDYYGLYEYVESYTSNKGYKVNMIQSTMEAAEGEENSKIAIFVVNNIKYTLTGCVSLENMKSIVDSMQ